jgi:NarL family two-component system response regulator LiaR
VLIVEDHPITRLGLETFFEQQPGIEVVGSVGDGRKALALVRMLLPDVLLLDTQLPTLQGYQVAVRVKRKLPQVGILVFTEHMDQDLIAALLKLGIAGYFLKTENLSKVSKAIQGIAKGEKGWWSRCVAEYISSLFEDKKQASPRLSWREIQVLRKIAAGKTNHQISLEMGISVQLIEKQMHSIFNKLGTDSRVETAVYAAREGIV